jgi:hypothetical protein
MHGSSRILDPAEAAVAPKGHIGTNAVVTGHHPFNKEYPPQGFMNFLSKNQNGKKRLSQTVIQWQFFNICLSLIEKRKIFRGNMVIPPRGPLRT